MNNYQQVVENKSNEEIVVVRWNKSTGNLPATVIDSIFIKPLSQNVIDKSSGLGGPESSGCAGAIVDSVDGYVRNKPTLRVQKNLNDPINWTHSRGGNSRKGYNTQCKAVINNTDIVPK